MGVHFHCISVVKHVLLISQLGSLLFHSVNFLKIPFFFLLVLKLVLFNGQLYLLLDVFDHVPVGVVAIDYVAFIPLSILLSNLLHLSNSASVFVFSLH